MSVDDDEDTALTKDDAKLLGNAAAAALEGKREEAAGALVALALSTAGARWTWLEALRREPQRRRRIGPGSLLSLVKEHRRIGSAGLPSAPRRLRPLRGRTS